MEYKFEKIYTLIAETPMIHFQHDQTGATLRATEVKPKLDRYLLKCAESDKIDQETLQSWLIKGNSDGEKKKDKMHDRKNFCYKMRIERKGRPDDSQITLDDCKFYFGNQGNGNKKELVFNNCELKIICFIPALREFIDKHIGDFFALHNFGTRQTKGFGGFRIDSQDDKDIATAIEKSGCFYFYADMSEEDQQSIKKRMDHALSVYSVMKNGLNLLNRRYIKGFSMRRYFEDSQKNQTGSDKAFIKSKIIKTLPDKTDRNPERSIHSPYANHLFIRALLGLAEQYEFRDDLRNCGGYTYVNAKGKLVQVWNPVGVAVINCPTKEDGTPDVTWDRAETNMKTIVDALKKKAEIQRFASPVLIKIYKNRIYFLFNDSYKMMLNKMFLFIAFNKPDKNTVYYESIETSLSEHHYIKTPAEFNVKEFIANFVRYFNQNRTKFAIFRSPYQNSQNLELMNPYQNT